MKPSSAYVMLAAVLPISAAIFAAVPATNAQQSATASPAPTHMFPAPTNLQVLPKDLTGAQVRDIMNGWEDALGVDCSTCHVRNPNDLAPNGRPRFNYADDSKQEKKTARVMYTMVDTINTNFVSRVPNSGVPVSCGTCHRGHLSPEPYNPDAETHRKLETPPAEGAAPAH